MKSEIKFWEILSKPLPKSLNQIREEIKQRETPEYLEEQAARLLEARKKSIVSAANTIRRHHPDMTEQQCYDKAVIWYDTKVRNL